MKRKILPMIIASITIGAFTSTATASDVVVYGKVNVNFNSLEKDQAGFVAEDNWDMSNAASRIGFKGKEKITDTLSAIYKLEYQIQPDGNDNGSSEEFKQRNTYVGLQSTE